MQEVKKKGICKDKLYNSLKIMLLFCVQFVILIVSFKLQKNGMSSIKFGINLILIIINCLLGLILYFQLIAKKKTENFNAFIFLFFASLAQILIVEILNPCDFNPISIIYVLLTFLIVYGLNLLIFAITNKITITIYITSIFFFSLGLVNHFYFNLRGDPFEISELTLIETAIGVIGEYEFSIDEYIIIATIQTLFLMVGTTLIYKFNNRFKIIKRLIILISGIASLLFVCLYEMPILDMWQKSLSVENYGYIYSTLVYADATFNVKAPQNYDTNEIIEFLNAQTDIEAGVEDLPNIIVIMNEAFADLPTTYDFETDIDIMPTIHNLKENTQKGWLYVSTFGGGTSNTEFEFLTGNSMAYMPVYSVPYVQYIKTNQYSLAKYLKKFNYKTVAYHPYFSRGYNRDLIYPLMGFDTALFIEDNLPANQYIRWCLSDESSYQNLFQLYESKAENENIFLFNVTMQNHGGYIAKSDNVKVTVNVKDEDKQSDELEEYLSLIKASDEAFSELINYFKKNDEKTIVLFFGDHQPSLDEEIYLKIDSNFAEGKSEIEERQKQSQVPFVIWANYDIEEKEDLIISANYLSILLLENAGIPLNNYQSFLKDLYTDYPVINQYGFYQNDKFYGFTTENKTINPKFYTYQNLVYANMFDKDNILEELWFNY